MSKTVAVRPFSIRVLTGAFALAMALVLAVPGGSNTAHADAAGDWQYVDSGSGEATLTQYLGTDQALVVPGTIGGLTVTRLGPGALKANNLTWIEFPDSLVDAGPAADWDQSSDHASFEGWFTEDGEQVDFGEIDVAGKRFFTHWSPAPVTLHANGLDADLTGLPLENTYGSATHEHYHFLGWAREANPPASAPRIPGSQERESGPATDLYAQWLPKSYPMTFYVNDGSGEHQLMLVDYGASFTFGSLNRADALFSGWASVASPGEGDALQASGEVYTVTGPADWFAQWVDASIEATAVDSADGDQELFAHGVATVSSTVTYSNLHAGAGYSLVTELVDTETGQTVVDAHGAPVGDTVTFTPDIAAGQVGFDTSFDGLLVADLSQVTMVHNLFMDGALVASFGSTDPAREAVTFAVNVPQADDLVDEHEDAISVTPAVVQPGDLITISAPSEAPGDTVSAHMFSAPTALGTHTLSANLDLSVQLPSDTTLGDHRIGLYRQDGSLVGWQTITVEAPDAAEDDGAALDNDAVDDDEPGAGVSATDGSLPVTGFTGGGLALAAVLLLLAGFTLTMVRRRAHTA